MNVEALVGTAVSLSNRDYPEIEDAIKRFDNGDVEGAQQYLEIARQKYPKLPPTEITLAKMFYYRRNSAAARQLLEKAALEHPDDPESYLLVADRAFAEGRTMEAEALFNQAGPIVEKYTDNAKRKKNFDIRMLAGKSAVFERRQQWEEALKLLRKWVEVDPDSVTARQRLGVTLFRTGKASEAFEEFKLAREMNSEAHHPYVLLGNLFTQEGELDKARKAFQQAYNEDKDNDQTARSYAEWLLRQNELSEAEKVSAAMRQRAPTSVTALLLDGVIARMQGRMAEAEEAFMQVLSVDPANVTATNFLALILAESDKPTDQEKALSHAQINAQRFPNQSQPSITLAWVLYRLNRPADGGKILQRALKLGGLNADSAYLVARILLQQNQKEQAQKTLETVLEQAGDGMFIYRNDAEKLLAQLKSEG
jgi:tetratricopeptide (TPR) repeat protein